MKGPWPKLVLGNRDTRNPRTFAWTMSGKAHELLAQGEGGGFGSVGHVVELGEDGGGGLTDGVLRDTELTGEIGRW